MAMIGQMVAGVAHEINTPLGYVKNNVLMLSDDILAQIVALLTAGQELEQVLNSKDVTEEEMMEALSNVTGITSELIEQELPDTVQNLTEDALFGINQISELVLSLRDFARLDQAKTKAVDIHECIESALRIGKDKLTGVAEVTKNYGTLPKITCSPAKINQVILNLLNNAIDAIKEQGQPGTISITTVADNQEIRIAVQDNGKGINEENLSRVFEPFFTTKGAGEGTGLGLAISTQIIEEHQGHMQVESKLGEGATFTIHLPIQPDAPAAS
jgi:signal transduction histidine kinase